MKIKRTIFCCINIVLFCCLTSLLNAQDKYPQRIISLGPNITEELYLLGVENRLVGTTVYCHNPIEAKKKEKVGTVLEINLEKIMMLEPDLILATNLTDPRTKEKLKNLGITVVTFPLAKNFAGVCEQFLTLGNLVGKRALAKKIVERAKNKADLIAKRVQKLPKPKVFIQVGTKPLFAVTKDYFVNDFIELAGGINITHGSSIGLYSREKVLDDNPDIIIIAAMEIDAEKEKEIWQKYRSLTALKNNQIYTVDPDKLCSPTPISFVEVLEDIANILHPQERGE